MILEVGVARIRCASDTTPAGRPSAAGACGRTQVAGAPGLEGWPRTGVPGPAAQVDDFRDRREPHLSAGLAQGRAEIDVLGVHEVALVQPACRVSGAAAHEQARPAHPIDYALTACCAIDPAAHGPKPRASSASATLRRASDQGLYIAPKDNSARPSRSTRRGPIATTPGSAPRWATRASIAPAVTIVSGLSSSTSSLSSLGSRG